LISILVVIVIFAYQQVSIRYNGCDLYCRWIVFRDINLTPVALIALLIFNCVIDYVSNTITVSLIELGESKCNSLQFIIIALSDVALTILVFTLLFPIGIIISIITQEFSKPIVRVDVALLSQDYIPRATENLLTLHDNDYIVSILNVKPLDEAPSSTPQKADLLFLMTKRGTTLHDQITSAATLLAWGDEDSEFVVGGKESGWSAVVSVLDYPDFTDMQWFSSAYQAAFSGANYIRDAFLALIRLRPVDETVFGFYSKLQDHYVGMPGVILACENGEMMEAQMESSNVNQIVAEGKNLCEGKMLSVILFPNAPSIRGKARSIAESAVQIPVGVFFTSSFIVSILYYLGILLTWIMLWIDRKTSQFFSARYLKTSRYPFSIIAAFFFSLFELARLVGFFVSNPS
jgi:hypothetical protein